MKKTGPRRNDEQPYELCVGNTFPFVPGIPNPDISEPLFDRDYESVRKTLLLPIIQRLTGALAGKREQHSRWVADGLISTEDPFIIAISGSKFGPCMLDPEHPLILYPLFGLEKMVATFKDDGVSVTFKPGLVRTKDNGAEIDNFLFRGFNFSPEHDPAFEVSAVIFSDRNFRDPEKFDDLVLIHNPSYPFGQDIPA